MLQARQVDPIGGLFHCGDFSSALKPLVLEAIRDLGLELQVIFNKGSVMVLPAGVNKATGLTAA